MKTIEVKNKNRNVAINGDIYLTNFEKQEFEELKKDIKDIKKYLQYLLTDLEKEKAIKKKED